MSTVPGVIDAKMSVHQMLSYLNSLKMDIKYTTTTPICASTVEIASELVPKVAKLFGKVSKKRHQLHTKTSQMTVGLYGKKSLTRDVKTTNPKKLRQNARQKKPKQKRVKLKKIKPEGDTKSNSESSRYILKFDT